MRVALYARVSTEDQARYGLSVEAQQNALRVWAEQNGHEVVGEYTDAGVSGKKPYKKRPELSHFMDDLESGLQVDALVFTKLDRFYRSVKLYYQAVDILEKYHVAWIAIHEDYETATASGRMKVNIMLSVAENEADRTSERIKTVFARKVELGQPITNSQPLGFKIEGKALVHDENAPAALAAFEHFAAHGNVSAARQMIQDEYGVRVPYEAVYRMLSNPLYRGSYRGNDAFCEPIVPLTLWNKVQHDLKNRKTRDTSKHRVYLFSGLIVCAECGRKMTANPGLKSLTHPENYRCPGYYLGHTCKNKKIIREYKLEAVLVDHIQQWVAGLETEVKEEAPRRPRINKAAIQRKLERLKRLYVEGDMSIEEYRAQRDELTERLAAADAEPPKKPAIRRVMGDNFTEDYYSWSREERKTFWRAIIDHMEFDSNGVIDYFFSPESNANQVPPQGSVDLALVPR